jgi:thioredoxin reductase (NADPH)
VIGGGPAGLTAAIYLARFRRSFRILDSGESRAGWDYFSHNVPGYPDGIASHELLKRLRRQAGQYGTEIEPACVTALRKEDEGFVVNTEGTSIAAKTVLIATGAVDIEPELPGITDAVRCGLIRHCPICDAYEVIDKKVALIGYGRCRLYEAILLRAYTKDLTLLTLGKELQLSQNERRVLADASVAIISDPVAELVREGDEIGAWRMHGGVELRFDRLYTALGLVQRSDLARDLGAEVDEDGALVTDAHQRTSVAGLYAAGDVVRGLGQISVAFGHAAIAATDINNRLNGLHVA